MFVSEGFADGRIIAAAQFRIDHRGRPARQKANLRQVMVRACVRRSESRRHALIADVVPAKAIHSRYSRQRRKCISK